MLRLECCMGFLPLRSHAFDLGVWNGARIRLCANVTMSDYVYAELGDPPLGRGFAAWPRNSPLPSVAGGVAG